MELLKNGKRKSVTAAQFPHQSALLPRCALKPLDNHTYDTVFEIPPATSLAQNVDGIWDMQILPSHNALASDISSPTPSKIELIPEASLPQPFSDWQLWLHTYDLFAFRIHYFLPIYVVSGGSIGRGLS